MLGRGIWGDRSGHLVVSRHEYEYEYDWLAGRQLAGFEVDQGKAPIRTNMKLQLGMADGIPPSSVAEAGEYL